MEPRLVAGALCVGLLFSLRADNIQIVHRYCTQRLLTAGIDGERLKVDRALLIFLFKMELQVTRLRQRSRSVSMGIAALLGVDTSKRKAFHRWNNARKERLSGERATIPRRPPAQKRAASKNATKFAVHRVCSMENNAGRPSWPAFK